MMAAPPLSSSSAASDLLRGRAFRRPFSLSPARFSASCASAGGSHCHYYPYSRGSDEANGGAAAAAAAAGGTLYDVLGLAAGATAQEIKQAYRKLALACHPDAAAGREGASADEFMRVHAAYATLSDHHKRAEYDRRMMVASAAARRPSSSSSASRSSQDFPRRTWETDQCW